MTRRRQPRPERFGDVEEGSVTLEPPHDRDAAWAAVHDGHRTWHDGGLRWRDAGREMALGAGPDGRPGGWLPASCQHTRPTPFAPPGVRPDAADLDDPAAARRYVGAGHRGPPPAGHRRGDVRWSRGPTLRRGRLPRQPAVLDGCIGCTGGRESVWVVLYPDCTGPDGDIGWVMVDVDERGYSQNTPCRN